MRIVLCIACSLLAAVPCAAATYVVPDSVATIGAALALAVAGDTVRVQPGTYPERLDLVDGVKLMAADPAQRPVVDGGGAGTVLTAVDCGLGTEVRGLVIRGGAGAGVGGGAYLLDSPIVLLDCRFEGNTAVHGAGVGADGSGFLLLGCELEGNTAAQTGGAVSATDASSPVLASCRFRDNEAIAGGAVALRNGCTAQISSCVFESNRADEGGALWYDFFAGGTLRSCTAAFNEAFSGLGAGVFVSPFATPTVTRCILAFGVTGGGVFVVSGATPVWGCNDVFGNDGGDGIAGGTDLGTNFSLDPLFCDAPGSVFTLRDDSPCLAGVTCPSLVGAFGAGGCGPTAAGQGLRVVSWGSLKARYR